MNLKSELNKIWRENKDNPDKESLLLKACERYMPSEIHNMFSFISVIKHIDAVWQEFAADKHMHPLAFRDWVSESTYEFKSLLEW